MTDRLDLPDRWRRQIEALLTKHIPEAEVWAYGSRVTGRNHEASDLDLVLQGPNLDRISIDQLSDLRDALDESNIPILVDIHDWARVPAPFKPEIERQYIRIRPAADECVELLDVGSFAPFSYGKSLPRNERNLDGSVPVYGSNGIIGWHDTALTSGPTVIIGRKGTAGAVHFSAVPCWPIDTSFFIEGSETDLLRYKYYLLRSLRLDERNADSAVPGLNRNDAHSIVIAPPCASVQRQIAQTLGRVDDRIELNRRMSETLEEMAQALFRSWFIDFDPVRSKMECRDTNLPDHIADLFPDRLVDSSLGPIPEGWRTCGLDQLATFVNGLALQKFPPTDDDSLPVIKIAQLRSGSVQDAARASANLDPKFIVDNGDIIFSWSGSLECRIWTSGRGALNQHLFKVVPDEMPRWLCYFAIYRHLSGFREIAAGKATTMGHIQRHHLRDAKLAIPSYDVLQRLNAAIAPILDRATEAAQEAGLLEALRDIMLPELISERRAVGVG